MALFISIVLFLSFLIFTIYIIDKYSNHKTIEDNKKDFDCEYCDSSDNTHINYGDYLSTMYKQIKEKLRDKDN